MEQKETLEEYFQRRLKQERTNTRHEIIQQLQRLSTEMGNLTSVEKCQRELTAYIYVLEERMFKEKHVSTPDTTSFKD